MMTTVKTFVKGLAVGAAAGIAISMAVNPIDSRDIKKLQKRTGRFFSSVGNVIDNVVDIH